MQSLKVQIHEIERLYYIESNCKAFVCSSLPFPKPLHLHVSPPPSSTIYITLSTVSSHKRSFVSLSFHQNGSHSKDPQPPLCHPSLQTHSPSAVPIPITASTLHPHARTAHSHPKTTTTKRTNSERKRSNFVQQQHPSKSPSHISHSLDAKCQLQIPPLCSINDVKK